MNSPSIKNRNSKVKNPFPPRPTASHFELVRPNSTFSSVGRASPRAADFCFFASSPLLDLCVFCVSALNFPTQSYPKLFEPIRSYPEFQPESTCDNLRSLADPHEIARDSLSWFLPKSQPISAYLNSPQSISPNMNFLRHLCLASGTHQFNSSLTRQLHTATKEIADSCNASVFACEYSGRLAQHDL